MIYLLDVGDIYDLGTVFAQVRGAAMISKLPLFQIFLNLGRGGGGCQIAIFTSIHIISHYPEGKGGGTFWTFFLFWLLPLPGGSKVAIMGWKVIYAPIIGYS